MLISAVLGIHNSSWNVYPVDTGELLYALVEPAEVLNLVPIHYASWNLNEFLLKVKVIPVTVRFHIQNLHLRVYSLKYQSSEFD